MEKRRAVLSLVLGAVAVGLLVYGLFYHVRDVWPKDELATMSSITPETAMIREVTVGGLKRDDSGQIRKTYEGQAPKACPT
jgi:hypothetical protein